MPSKDDADEIIESREPKSPFDDLGDGSEAILALPEKRTNLHAETPEQSTQPSDSLSTRVEHVCIKGKDWAFKFCNSWDPLILELTMEKRLPAAYKVGWHNHGNAAPFGIVSNDGKKLSAFCEIGEQPNSYMIFGDVLAPLLPSVFGIPRAPRPNFKLEHFRSLIESLVVVHYSGYIHRYIRPANILWKECSRFVLSDYGFAIKVGFHAVYQGTIETASQRLLLLLIDPKSDEEILASREDDLESLLKCLRMTVDGRSPPLFDTRGNRHQLARSFFAFWSSDFVVQHFISLGGYDKKVTFLRNYCNTANLYEDVLSIHEKISSKHAITM